MDDNFNDYFTETPPPETKPEREETPQEREDREIAEATIERRHSTLRLVLMGVVAVLALTLLWWVWSSFFHPYSEGTERGWIMQVNNQGAMFRTTEGKMLSERYAADTIAFQCDFHFTITDDSLAQEAKRLEGRGTRVAVTYKEYRHRVLWRGESRYVVTAIDIDSTALDTARITAHRYYQH